MAGLYRRSVIYADVKNVVVSFDTVVASRLCHFFDKNDIYPHFFFHELYNYCKRPSKELIFDIMASKRHTNFLMDFFNWKDVTITQNPVGICETLYEEIMRVPVEEGDILENPDISNIMTSIGKSLQILIKDKNMDMLYLYMEDYVPKEIYDGLKMFYSNTSKVRFISGGKTRFLKENPCDSYFFEDSTTIDDVAFPHTNLSEVLVPATPSNWTIVDQIEETSLRIPITKMSLEQYKSDFNLNIHTIALPI